MRASRVLLLVALVALLASALRSTPADACAGVGRHGPVAIEREEALIVWEPGAGKEHFIRTAAFPSMPADFGFLVPTPARPELAEVDDGVFSRLFEIYRAPMPHGSARGLRSRSIGPQPSVTVLERRSVAGLDATVLAATDAAALDRWLARHRYPAGPELRAWLDHYVRERWIVTAFRIDPGARGGAVRTRAVRMSFRTDRPFFPYSEPQHDAREPRPFRVSVVAPFRVRGVEGARYWEGGTVGYAGQPSDRLSRALTGIPIEEPIGPSTFLTVFDEPRSVRGTEDVFFERDPDQGHVAPRLRSPIVIAR